MAAGPMSDAEKAALAPFLAEHNITTPTWDALAKLLSLATSLADTFKQETESKKDRTDKVKAEILGYKQAAMSANKIAREITSELDNIFSADPYVSVHLVEALKSVLSFVKDEAEWTVDKVVRERAPQKVTHTEGQDAGSRRLVLDAARNYAETFFTVLGMIDAENKPADVKVKKNKAGEVVLDLPALPRGNFGGSGRSAKSAMVQYEWNGEVLPAGTFPKDIVRQYVSQGFYQLTYSQFLATLKEQGIDFPGQKEWEAVFPTGRLHGWIPSESNDDENEESDTE